MPARLQHTHTCAYMVRLLLQHGQPASLRFHCRIPRYYVTTRAQVLAAHSGWRRSAGAFVGLPSLPAPILRAARHLPPHLPPPATTATYSMPTPSSYLHSLSLRLHTLRVGRFETVCDLYTTVPPSHLRPTPPPPPSPYPHPAPPPHTPFCLSCTHSQLPAYSMPLNFYLHILLSHPGHVQGYLFFHLIAKLGRRHGIKGVGHGHAPRRHAHAFTRALRTLPRTDGHA